MPAPYTQVPGPSAEGTGASVLRENTFTMVSAFMGSLSDASISAGDTFMGKAVPTSTRWLTRGPSRAAASSAISEPQLWPTSAACATPSASSTAATVSAACSTLAGASPPLRPWPGRSSASTFQPWWASQRVCRIHTLWSFSTPWMNTAVGCAGLKGLPPV